MRNTMGNRFDRLCFFFTIGYRIIFFFFFFNDTATTEIYTLSLHDALPISKEIDLEIPTDAWSSNFVLGSWPSHWRFCESQSGDRKSTRLNSSHVRISYAVFCLKKKKKQTIN